MKVPINSIRVAKDRGRKLFGDLKGMRESIEKHGLLHPLVVAKSKEEGCYDLIAGERRYRCLMLLGKPEVEVNFLKECSPLQQKEIELEENMQRQKLEWDEQMEILAQIDETKRLLYGDKSRGDKGEGGWTQKDTADSVGIDRTTASKQLQFARKLRARPDIATVIRGLPQHVAARQYEKILEVEKLQQDAKEGKVKLFNDLQCGDCLTLIKRIDTDSIDLILTDPPFGYVEIENMVGDGRSSDSSSYIAQLKDTDNLNAEKVAAIMTLLIPELARVLKPGAHLYMFCAAEQWRNFGEQMKVSGMTVRHGPLVWDKTRPTEAFRGNDFMSSHDLILFAKKNGPVRRLNDKCKDILSFKMLHSAKRLHPFEKPQELLQHLISLSTHETQRVLDPFAGSASTIVAALALNRSGIGFELDEDRFLQAQKRLVSANGTSQDGEKERTC